MRLSTHPLFRQLFLASLWRRPLASGLSLLAIALGVTLGLAVQLIHTAALGEFERGIRLLGGQADLQLVGPSAGFAETLYAPLALDPLVAAASPVVEVRARLPEHDSELTILGVDLFRLAPVTPALLPSAQARTEEGESFAALREDALFLSAAALARLDLAPGDRLEVQLGVERRALRIAGTLPGLERGQVLGVMDIGAAQQVFGRLGRLDRVDLRLVEGVDLARAQAHLADSLPPGLRLRGAEEAAGELRGLSRAYRVNLSMLAAIALATGGFLVFSTQWLAVVRRRQEFALLRALGLDRRRLWRWLLGEGALLGLIGALIGVLLSHGLAALAVSLLGADLGAGFFEGVQPRLTIEPGIVLFYLALGVAVGLAGAWLPAREAAHMLPARGLRAGDEAEVYRARPRWALAWLVLALAGLSALAPPLGGIPVFGYVAVALLLAAAVLMLPGLTLLLLGRWPWRGAVLLRLAQARLAGAPGQVAVAAAGVVTSVALAVSMAIMVHSFRVSLDDWLVQMLPADLYVRAGDTDTSGFLDARTLAWIDSLPEVRETRPVRFESLRLAGLRESVGLIARPVDAHDGLPLVAGALELESGGARAAWVSEALADRLRLGVGDALTLPIGARLEPFQVAGIWRDYARQQGAVVIELEVFRALTGEQGIDTLGLYLAPTADIERLMAQIRARLGEQLVEMIRPGELRAIILRVFDRTFLVTYVMEAVAILIGLFGVATTFAALANSRRREFGILRHLGLRRREIGALLAREAALSAALGLVLGLLAGAGIALVLIEVINRQSFGWSMDLAVPLVGLGVFGLALLVLAALAARLAARGAMRQAAVRAVREDW